MEHKNMIYERYDTADELEHFKELNEAKGWRIMSFEPIEEIISKVVGYKVGYKIGDNDED